MKKIQLGGHRKGSKIKGYALVDDEDFNWLNQFSWHCFLDCGLWRVCRNQIKGEYKIYKLKRIIYLSRIIWEKHFGKISNKYIIDHKDRNALNNQLNNLRLATHSQNMMNRIRTTEKTSKYKGVSQETRSKRWLAIINKDGKRHYLGLFETPEKAAESYDSAAKKLFGEYAKLNFNNPTSP